MGSLQEELSAAFDQGSTPVESAAPEQQVTTTEPAVETPPESTPADAARDEQGRFKAATDPAAPEPSPLKTEAPSSAPAPVAAGPETERPVTPPSTWSAAAKSIYATLPEVARKEIAKREADYARGIQMHADKARFAETLMREIQPYEAMLRAEGSTPDKAVASLMRSAYVLRTASPQQKGELIMQIAQQYGADLSQFVGQRESPDGQQDPSNVQQTVQQLLSPYLQRLQAQEQQQAQAQQEQAAQVEREISSQIEAFRSATNQDGTPKHLYFENVRGEMSALMANGRAQSLDQAYEMACWANPEVRAALIADQQSKAEAQRLEEAKRKAKDAGRAGFNVQGQGGVGIAGATQSSLRDDLSAQFDAALGGARV